MKALSHLSRRRQAAIIATILVVNLIIACVLYETAGWHYIRGYREVTTLLIYPVILAHAMTNLILCGLLALANLTERSEKLSAAVFGLLTSAVLLAISLPFAPVVGSILKYNLVLPTPIAEAAGYQDGKLVKVLLASGADPNTRGRAGLNATALHAMAASGNTEVVELLLQKGADPNARANVMQEFPLHSAVFNRAPQSTILVLLKYGADPNRRDRDGRTAFDYTPGHPDPQGLWLRKTMSGLPYDPLPRDSAEPAR